MKVDVTMLAILAFTLTIVLANNEFVVFTTDERGVPMAHVTIDVPTVFPESPADLTGFNLDVGYTNYNDTLFHKLAEDLSPDAPLDTRVGAVVGVLHGKEYDPYDENMQEDFLHLYEMAHPVTAASRLLTRQATWRWSRAHAINMVSCAGFLSCVSGTTCNFYVTVGKAPRSRCESQGGQNCCMSWANYSVKVAFFQLTWTRCYNSRPDDKESCEGYDNGSGNGGDVCFSNRADGCT